MKTKPKYVKSLREAESIVANNPQLHWNGWDMIHNKPDHRGFERTNGAFYNNTWTIQTVISPSRNGWRIPGEFIR